MGWPPCGRGGAALGQAREGGDEAGDEAQVVAVRAEEDSAAGGGGG